MKERDIQNYLFENPEYIFPNQCIQEKFKEFAIEGKRIDLLFQVDNIKYIIEIKNTPIDRKHIGQVVEYYGLMKTYFRAYNFKMILVSPYIENYQKVFLEELGIRCTVFDITISNELTTESIIFNEESKPIANTKNKCWLVSVERENPGEVSMELKQKYKHFAKNPDNLVHVIRFPCNVKGSFVKQADAGDSVILIERGENTIVIPQSEILLRLAIDSDVHFVIETPYNYLQNSIRFSVFSEKLRDLNIVPPVNIESVRQIPEKYKDLIVSIWS